MDGEAVVVDRFVFASCQASMAGFHAMCVESVGDTALTVGVR
jgi:hypothetical protein